MFSFYNVKEGYNGEKNAAEEGLGGRDLKERVEC
jgi:hypothetical protein